MAHVQDPHIEIGRRTFLTRTGAGVAAATGLAGIVRSGQAPAWAPGASRRAACGPTPHVVKGGSQSESVRVSINAGAASTATGPRSPSARITLWHTAQRRLCRAWIR